MRTMTCVMTTIMALAICAAGQGLADVGTDDDDVPVQRSQPVSRSARTSSPDEDDASPDEPPNLAAPVPPSALRRSAGASNAVKMPGRATPTPAPTTRAGKGKKSVTEDPFLDDPDESAAATIAPPAGRANRLREADAPERRTTINRSDLAPPRVWGKSATVSEIEDDDDAARPSIAADQHKPSRRVVQASAEDDAPVSVPRAAPQTFAFPQDEGAPDAPPATASLEEQIAELRARLDDLTRVPERTPAMTPAPSSATSTVPGSVFGPDAVTAKGSYISDGLTFTSADGNFKSHIGGVVQLDALGFGTGTNGITAIPGGAGTQEAVEFRRLRLRGEGMMYNNIDWVLEVDLALALQNTDQLNTAAQVTGLRSFPTGVGVQGGNTINVIQPTTVFMTFKDIPVLGNVRVGNQQNWISFDHIESARFLDFMERAPIMDAFSGPSNNGYAPGISAFNNTPDKSAGAQIGVYKNNAYDSGFTYNIGDAWIYGGRVIWTPYFDEESKGRNLLHLGVGSEYRTFNDNVSATTAFDNVRIRSRGDLRNAASTLDPNYADTGNFYAESQVVLNPEIAFQWGPLLIQSEWSTNWFYGAKPAKNVPTSLGSVYLQGGYVETLYFLTGENRVYNRQSGVFGRTIPKSNFNFKERTWGAWQVGLRYDWLDLNSGPLLNGGNSSDMTVGLNWFLNPNARFQLNYVMSWVNNAAPVTFPGTVGALNGARFVGDGTINSYGGRLDFTY